MNEISDSEEADGALWWWTSSEATLDQWWKSLTVDTQQWLMTNTKEQDDAVVASVIRGIPPNSVVTVNWTRASLDSANAIPTSTYEYVRAKAYQHWRRGTGMAGWT